MCVCLQVLVCEQLRVGSMCVLVCACMSAFMWEVHRCVGMACVCAGMDLRVWIEARGLHLMSSSLALCLTF